MNVTWYARRLSRMGPREVAGRLRAAARVRRWRGESASPPRPRVSPHRSFPAVLDAGFGDGVTDAARQRLLTTADRVMTGHADYFGVTRDDMVEPDWSYDPKTGRRAPEHVYAFDIAYRDEGRVGDVKQLWEPSRHQHLTVLAAAYALTGHEPYAERVAEHLRSWWAANPPLCGVHWVSGIELGIRLLSWVWTRRLLDGWHGAPDLFEHDPDALGQIWHHQRWLAALPSHGSSANNHAVAETAGQLAASCAFDWFDESPRWRAHALRMLDRHLEANTFDSGLNRELATEYHGLVLELGLAAVAEADAAGVVVPESSRSVLLRMCDALAAIVDTDLRPPRQGDADEGHGLIVDGAGTGRWSSLLATGDALFGRADWWPEHAVGDLRTALLSTLTRTSGRTRAQPSTAARPTVRPAHFADAGLTILRAPSDRDGGEIWCRCDGGPHGFLAIAAHAHADALSVELRHNGVDILADPGTYCYHGEPEWRGYFRSTLAHNTLELGGMNQSRSGGPFLWTRHARSRVLVAHADQDGVSRWRAEHDGYRVVGKDVVHRRSAELDGDARVLRVTDEVHGSGQHTCRLAFHLGPCVTAKLADDTAVLRWSDGDREHTAHVRLPGRLSWSAHRGAHDPPLGWYSPAFGKKQPSTVLLGTGVAGGAETALHTTIEFGP